MEVNSLEWRRLMMDTGTHLIHFDLAAGLVSLAKRGQGNEGRLTQEQDLDRPGVLTGEFFLVKFVVDSVGPLLCPLLRPYPVLPLVVGFVGGRSEDVSERIVCEGARSGGHPQ